MSSIEATKPAFDVGKLDGVEKAAILLLSLSEEDAGLLNDWLLKYNYKVKGDK